MSHLSESRAEALEQTAVTNVDSTLGTICERVQASVAAVASVLLSQSLVSVPWEVEDMLLLMGALVLGCFIVSHALHRALMEDAPGAPSGLGPPPDRPTRAIPAAASVATAITTSTTTKKNPPRRLMLATRFASPATTHRCIALPLESQSLFAMFCIIKNLPSGLRWWVQVGPQAAR
jgi:hypothetical protein